MTQIQNGESKLLFYFSQFIQIICYGIFVCVLIPLTTALFWILAFSIAVLLFGQSDLHLWIVSILSLGFMAMLGDFAIKYCPIKFRASEEQEIPPHENKSFLDRARFNS